MNYLDGADNFHDTLAQECVLMISKYLGMYITFSFHFSAILGPRNSESTGDKPKFEHKSTKRK